MPFNADGCHLVISSPHGSLMHLDFPMAYLMSRMNDGILVEAAFNMFYEEEGISERKLIRIRIEEIQK